MRHRAAAASSAVCLALFAAGAARAELSEAQAARLAELRPDSVLVSRGNNAVSIRGGDLGRFDARTSAVENLRKLIIHLGVLHDAARSAEFSVTEQMPGFVRFVQLIGGIPVTARIEVDLGPEEQVREARLKIVDPALAPKAQPISRERAMQVASLACAAQASIASADVELNDYPGLHYRPAALGEPLKLQYRFYARAGDAPSTIVTVDAYTAAVKIAPGAIP